MAKTICLPTLKGGDIIHVLQIYLRIPSPFHITFVMFYPYSELHFRDLLRFYPWYDYVCLIPDCRVLPKSGCFTLQNMKKQSTLLIKAFSCCAPDTFFTVSIKCTVNHINWERLRSGTSLLCPTLDRFTL